MVSAGWLLVAALGLGPAAAMAEDAAAAARSLHQAALLAQVEMALDELGYDIDSPDGLPDPRTEDALARFRRQTGAAPGQAIDEGLVAALRAAVAAQADRRLRQARKRIAEEEVLVRRDLEASAPLSAIALEREWVGAARAPR
jgi:peptidoglycan hydrolase-like protein with peptidoglycan-binding domain